MNIELQNLGTVNKNRVSLEKGSYVLEIFFSYSTPVGFVLILPGEHKKIVRVNDWGSTTGKLINSLQPDKKERVDGKMFIALLEDAVNKFIAYDAK